jgi:DNA-dependent protein kinase catalytic subunit
MAVFSIASYLIGIGDRHLENFLIDTSDGEVLGIDFGMAFGSNVHLHIPELMPFRLTQQIEGVISPHPLGGIYKQTMVHALNAMRKKKSLILDTCEIFVKEPLLDWVKDAKQRNRSSGSAGTQIQDEGTQVEWYPRTKIEQVRKKLQGVSPIKLLQRELRDSQHSRKDYMKSIEKAIHGPEDGVRNYHKSLNLRYLEVED